MYLFIFESIGTSELVLIGMIALIVFGPRKLPQMAKTIGKTMAEFRKTTQDFKSTWEKEVNFEEEKKILTETITDAENNIIAEKTIETTTTTKTIVTTPEIKEIDADNFVFPENNSQIDKTRTIKELPANKEISEKQSWL